MKEFTEPVVEIVNLNITSNWDVDAHAGDESNKYTSDNNMGWA